MSATDEPVVVEVQNLPYRLSDPRNTLLQYAPTPFVSFNSPPKSGKALVELPSRAAAEAFMRSVRGIRIDGRTIRAELVANAQQSFVQAQAIKRWPFVDLSASPQEEQDAKNTEDLTKVFHMLPSGPMRTSLYDFVASRTASGDYVLKEIYLAQGRTCELVFSHRFGGPDVQRSHQVTEEHHIADFLTLFEGLPSEVRRTGIDDTLHRISRSVHAVQKRVVAVTARIGRTLQGGCLPMLCDSSAEGYQVNEGSPRSGGAQLASPNLADLLRTGLLLIGPPNTGKTTVLRELARLLSLGCKRVVVVVDKSMEIAGTGLVPHPAIGNARVLTVETPSAQHRAMLEAVENQSPDVVIVDELSTKEECAAARTITGRGVCVIASVHGDSLASLAGDPERSLLLGGVGSVTLGAKEAEARADGLRQVTRRLQPSVFGCALELRGFTDWILHPELEGTVDRYLDFVPFPCSWRTCDGGGSHGAAAAMVVDTPLVGCRQHGSAVGFAYARLRPGERLMPGKPVDFLEVAPNGQHVWTQVNDAGSPAIYEKTATSAGAANGHANGFRF